MNCSTEDQIKSNFCNFLRKTLKTTIQSHDFRTTKITQLIHAEKVPVKVVAAYVGHDNIATTLGYVKVDQEEALQMIQAASHKDLIPEDRKQEITVKQHK